MSFLGIGCLSVLVRTSLIIDCRFDVRTCHTAINCASPKSTRGLEIFVLVFDTAFWGVVVQGECPVEVVGLVGMAAVEEDGVEGVGLES